MAIRNLDVEHEHNMKNNDHQVITYKLSPEEIEEKYGHIKKKNEKENILIGYAYDGNPLKTDKAQIIIKCLDVGMSREDIVKKYGYSLCNINKIINQLKKKKKRKNHWWVN